MKNILEYLECSAGRWPEKTACADTDTSMTWRMLREAAARIGSLLLMHRMTHRPVAVYMEKTPACLAAMLGTVYGGDFYTVIDTKMPWDRIRKIFSVLKPAAVITDRDHEETVREAMEAVRKDRPKVLLYENAMHTPEDRRTGGDPEKISGYGFGLYSFYIRFYRYAKRCCCDASECDGLCRMGEDHI